ncbi:MAG: hypothetical protein H3C31_09230 [Brumimicrobium sp.]|nr:hypothetical protein [Brumimicrobium sp.]MCO5269986.1 hypothetical protein [Brumimicrobium sp.]
MLDTLFKKRLSDEVLAKYFVNGILNTIEQGFNEIKSFLEEDPAFVTPPDLKDARNGHFAMIVIAGNIGELSNTFSPSQQKSLMPVIFNMLADSLGMEEKDFKELYNDYAAFMKRVNYPSKVTLYSMSKGMFHKYGLNEYQENYFKSLNTPNPLFIKRMDEIMKNFLWNWDAFFKRYKVY